MENFEGPMSGEQFMAWLLDTMRDNPDSVFEIRMERLDIEDEIPHEAYEIPHEAYEMNKTVHFRHQCPHLNIHGTQDVEIELDGHHVIMRGWHNGQRQPGFDGEWPVVQRLPSDEDALRFYLRVRRDFVNNNFEIIDA